MQKRITRILPGLEGDNYKERLDKFELFSMEYLRLRGYLIKTI